MNINELNAHIIDWAKERELDTKGTVEAQTIKTVEELSELIKAICKDKKEDIIDSIGDVYVTLVIGNMLDSDDDFERIYEMAVNDERVEFSKDDMLVNLSMSIYPFVEEKYLSLHVFQILRILITIAYNYKLDFVECVESAYNTIKDRKGKLVNGTYVKNEDLKNEITDIFFDSSTDVSH